jgi:RNA-binding protein
VSGQSTQPAPTAKSASAPALNGAQRRYLRGLAHPLKPIIFVGEGGISPAVLKALDEALASHELVKIRLRQPANKKAAAEQLARDSSAGLCGVVGHTIVLYRPHPDEPKIELPQPSSSRE